MNKFLLNLSKAEKKISKAQCACMPPGSTRCFPCAPSHPTRQEYRLHSCPAAHPLRTRPTKGFTSTDVGAPPSVGLPLLLLQAPRQQQPSQSFQTRGRTWQVGMTRRVGNTWQSSNVVKRDWGNAVSGKHLPTHVCRMREQKRESARALWMTTLAASSLACERKEQIWVEAFGFLLGNFCRSCCLFSKVHAATSNERIVSPL